MDRFARYKELLSKSGFFKLVCGAGNEDIDEVIKHWTSDANLE